jgi:dynactin complex subunit
VKKKRAQPQKAVQLLSEPKRKTEQILNKVLAVPLYIPLRTEKEMPQNKWTDEEAENDVICFANLCPQPFLLQESFEKTFAAFLLTTKARRVGGML